MTNPLQLTERTSSSRSHLNQRRKQGHIPAVLYGAHVDTMSVEVNEKEITETLRRNPHAVLQVLTPNHGQKSALVRDSQRDVVTGKLLHVDFFQINVNEKIDTKTAIHFIGEPAGVKNGGILQVEIHEIEVRCMADKLLTSFEVDIGGLEVGDQLLVSDLAFHEGVEVLTDPSLMLATVLPNIVRQE